MAGFIKKRPCWVIKIGSALLTNDGKGLNVDGLADWAKQMAWLKAQGVDVVLVSSGAVAAGMERLSWKKRPVVMNELQAAASVGQSRLVQAWEAAFLPQSIVLAQILLDADDLSNRERYLNARSTIKTLLMHGVVPIINENDTVVTDEIRFGDNDTLAGLVANLIDADQLILLTDQLGLFTADPRFDSDAELIRSADVSDPLLVQVAGGSVGNLGRGGMQTKVKAAKLAARSGTDTYIASGRVDDVLVEFYQSCPSGTVIKANESLLLARKRWLAAKLKPKGRLVLDDGAVNSLQKKGKSLLAVGLAETYGHYMRGDLVVCLSKDNTEIARGLVNYSSDEVSKIKGLSSRSYKDALGYQAEDELIHRDNLVITI